MSATGLLVATDLTSTRRVWPRGLWLVSAAVIAAHAGLLVAWREVTVYAMTPSQPAWVQVRVESLPGTPRDDESSHVEAMREVKPLAQTASELPPVRKPQGKPTHAVDPAREALPPKPVDSTRTSPRLSEASTTQSQAPEPRPQAKRAQVKPSDSSAAQPKPKPMLKAPREVQTQEAEPAQERDLRLSQANGVEETQPQSSGDAMAPVPAASASTAAVENKSPSRDASNIVAPATSNQLKSESERTLNELLPQLNNPKPLYPRVSQRLGEQGTVKLSAWVNAQGLVQEVKLLASSGHRRLDQAAMRAVRQWAYELPDGQEMTPQWLLVPVTFDLRAR